MLPDAPCIHPLIGCSDTTTFATSSFPQMAQTGTSSSFSSSRASYWSVFDRSSSSSASSSFASSIGFTDGQFTSQYSSQKQRLSVYTITVRNRGTTPLVGVQVTHGPTPSGATFDQNRSTQGCQAFGTNVQCSVDLAGGESKDLTITYIVNNSTSCSIARPLQSVQVSSPDAAGSVSCMMKNDTISGLFSSSSISSSALSSAAYSYSSTPSDVFGTQQYFSSSASSTDYYGTSGTTYDPMQNAGQGTGKGYKPYYQPKTGVLSDLFARPTTASMLFPVGHKTADSAMPISAWGVMGVLGLLLLGTVVLALLKARNRVF